MEKMINIFGYSIIFIEVITITLTFLHLSKLYKYAEYCYNKQINKGKAIRKKEKKAKKNIIQENMTQYLDSTNVNNILRYPNIVFYLNGKEIKSIRLKKDKISIGRAQDNDIVIDEFSISRGQCSIYAEKNKYFINNNVKSNPILINNNRIDEEKEELNNDDIVSLGNGNVSFKFVMQAYN